MEAKDYLKMPSLVNSNHVVRMNETEMFFLFRTGGKAGAGYSETEITAANAAVLSGKLCQMANGAIYADNGDITLIHNRKLDALEDIIEAANGQPVLVAYWFRHDLDRIQERLDSLGYRYGRINTDANIAEWNRGGFEVGLIHPASAVTD